MNQYSVKDFGKIIKKNAQSQRHDLLESGTNVFRIYDRNQEDFPITVDIYSNYARVQVYSDDLLPDDVSETVKDQINRMAYIDSDKICFSYRGKRLKGEQHEKTDNPAVIVEVKENNLVFKTDLTSYADTGLFLDHINTRKMVSEMCAGLNVLNLFSYTGSFSVYAASGRAATVTSVDLSATYTRWAEENLKANGFEGENYKCVCCDALKFVEEAISDGKKYDLIIFDPPAFSNSHKMEHDFDVQKDFYLWIHNLSKLLSKNGIILFSTNLGSFKIDRRRLRGYIVKETTNQLWADGFVKGRKGTTRSWIMAIDDNSLTLDWSEDSKPEKKREPRKEDGRRREGRPSERRYGDRDRRSSDRRFNDRERRSSGYDRPKYNHRDRDERDFDRKPRYERSDREERFSERSERRDNRNFDRKPRYEHSDYDSKHKYSSDRRESRNDRPRYEHSEGRERSSSNRYDRPANDYKSRNDRQRSERFDKPKAQRKPYGYDSFKPARSRDDSADFFWNED